jgi:hypothetical protein
LTAATIAAAPAPSPEERRAQARLAWLERAEEALREVREAIEAGRVANPAALASKLKSIAEFANTADCLETADKNELLLRGKAISLAAYERAFEDMLARGREAIRNNDKQAIGALPKTAVAYLGELRKLGMGQEGIDSLKEKLEILRQTSHAGQSEKAKAPEKETGPKPYVGERRMFMRYTDPVLTVEIGGRLLQTLAWSLGGALLGEVEKLPAPFGKPFTITVKIEGGKRCQEQATVVRFDPEKKLLALQFRRFGSALAGVKRECEALGMEPS